LIRLHASLDYCSPKVKRLRLIWFLAAAAIAAKEGAALPLISETSVGTAGYALTHRTADYVKLQLDALTSVR